MGGKTIQTDQHHYLIGLGSNQYHPGYGGPRAVIRAAFAELSTPQTDILAKSSVISSRPLGPSHRQYANAGIWLQSALPPDRLLILLKSVEHRFGRRYLGQKWRSRILDLDIIFWSGGIWKGESPPLDIPHKHARFRSFVLGPLCEIAPHWRDPVSGKAIKQIFRQLMRPKRLDP